jgi:hypothetical protein
MHLKQLRLKDPIHLIVLFMPYFALKELLILPRLGVVDRHVSLLELCVLDGDRHLDGSDLHR